MWRNPLRSFRHIGSADYIRRCCSSLRELRTSVNLLNPKNGSKLPSRDFANPPNRYMQAKIKIRMKRTFILLTSLLVLSCNQNTKTNENENLETKSNTKTKREMTENLDWLTGNWKRLNEEAGKETFENWEKISPSEYSGIGFTIQKGDTISQEKMDIIETNGKWTLFVKMPNDKEATKFEMTELKNNEFVCVNDSIDFPKKIKYWTDGEKIKAKISNEEMEIPFEFSRIK